MQYRHLSLTCIIIVHTPDPQSFKVGSLAHMSIRVNVLWILKYIEGYLSHKDRDH